MKFDFGDYVECTFPGYFEDKCTGDCAECPYAIWFCDDVGDSREVRTNYISTK